MIDDDDVAIAAALWNPTGPVSAIIGLAVVVALAWAACSNDAECAKRSCPHGLAPRLLDHECVCVTEPE